MRMFLDEVNIWTGQLGKADSPPPPMWVGLIQTTEGLNRI